MTTLPSDLKQGTWTIDPAHSEFGFTVRHAGISKVRGQFSDVSGQFHVGEALSDSSVTAVAQANSFSSGQEGRDGHVKGSDFFDAEQFPELTFSSSEIKEDDGGYVLEGHLTIKDVTQPVKFDVEYNGTAVDHMGVLRAGFDGTTQINRKDFGLSWNAAMEGGGLVLGDKVTIGIDLAGVFQES